LVPFRSDNRDSAVMCKSDLWENTHMLDQATIFQYTRWHSIIINERGSHRAHRSAGRECIGLTSAFSFLRTTPTGDTVGLYFNGTSSYLRLTLYGLILYLLRAMAELSARLMLSVLHDIIIAVVMADLSMRPTSFLVLLLSCPSVNSASAQIYRTTMNIIIA
jgi:hypothetical protein